LVVAGGDIVASGKRKNGEDWIIALRHPRNRSKYLATFKLNNQSVVTSGDYERYKIVQGERYHHIFNPKTGYSCGENQSVTILAPDPIVADILSTGLFCLPADSILAYVESRSGLEGLIVNAAGEVYISTSWKSEVKLIN